VKVAASLFRWCSALEGEREALVVVSHRRRAAVAVLKSGN
jgi:hypothetical protein